MEKPQRYQLIHHQGESEQSSEDEDATLLPVGAIFGRRRRYIRVTLIVVGVIIALIVYSGALVIATLKLTEYQKRQGTRFLKSPVSDFLSYVPHVMEQWEDVKPDAKIYFTGKPRPEIDQNWHDLLNPMNTRVPRDVMAELGRLDEGIRFPDGTYFGQLMVFHHLHCLKRIYQALHPEYYGAANLTSDEKAGQQDHTEHCLHMLKEAIMCQGDPTLLTMKWSRRNPLPIGNLTSPHECVNWDRLMEWVQPNSIDVLQDGILVHPENGPVFVNGDFAEKSKGTSP
ncbi:hypothetical protein F5B17DRAFT_448291 [Nemania serpens]|nr:hypothetical protein F5B17DRAFT_448291 [Nemania serpens]